MNKGDKIESELLDGTKITYALDNTDTDSLVLLDGTKITVGINTNLLFNDVFLFFNILFLPSS